jgi:hypothetical protein
VVRATLEELNAVARRADPKLHDPAGALALHRALEEYLPRRRQAIGTVEFTVDGRAASSLYAALVDLGRPFEELGLRRTGPSAPAARWEYLRPFDSLSIAADGAAEITRADGPPVRAIARLMLREQYVPMPPAGPAPATVAPAALPRPVLFTPPAFAAYVRATGVVPFGLALAVYYAEERIRYEIDLVDSALVLDPRTDRLPSGRRIARSARLGHAVDTLVAAGELAVPSARAFEVVVESNGLSAMDLAPLYGGVRELAATALDALVARKLLHFDRRTGQYRPRLEALGVGTDRGRPSSASASSRATTRLRTSVMELIAAADSRATCPLCGQALPPGAKGILCANCQLLIGEGGPTRPAA